MSTRRLTDPVYLQFIWNAIETFNNKGSEPTFPAILSYVRAQCDPKCTEFKLNTELSNAIRDGCIKLEQQAYCLVDVYSTFQRGKNDWYCYECHGPGRVVPCPTCFRVFHSDCLTTANETHWSCRLPVEDPTVGSDLEPDAGLPPNYPCPVCQRLERVTEPKTASMSDLQKIFCSALDWIRNKVHWRTMQKVGYLYEPRRNEFLVYRQINTRMIGDKMRADPTKDGYPNRTSLLVELDNLVHNAAVLYGSKNDMSNMARQIRSQLRRAMRESVFCVDCYLRPASMSSVARLTAPCRKAHRLLWFQHNGWSFRPCKMLYESSEGYEVVCFGGRHEREFVPRPRAVDMTFTALELGLRLTPSLKKALDEAEEYKANQSAYDRGLSTSLPIETKPPRKKSRESEKTISSRQSSISSVDGGEVPSRKRKAGSKYHSAFGSVDSSSTVSANSSAISGPKRRKSNPTASCDRRNGTGAARPSIGLDSYAPPLQARLRNLSADSSHDFTDDESLSSSSLDSESDGNAPLRLPTNTRSLSMTLRPAANVIAAPSHSSSKEQAHLITRISVPQVCANEGTTASNHSAHFDHSVHPKSPVTTKPEPTSAVSTPIETKPAHHRVIRIKPLPVRPPTQCDNSGSLSSPEHTPDLQPSPLRAVDEICKPRVKSKKPSTSASSSASSALSYPSSSGHATIPAVASSLDGHVSSDSVRSSSASDSTMSTKLNMRGCRLPKHAKQSEVVKTHGTRASRLKMQLAPNPPDASKPGLPAAATNHPRSLSSVSSLRDSDSSSSASSPLSHSRTPSPSSSELSSSTSSVSSSSTTLLPSSSSITRRLVPPGSVRNSTGSIGSVDPTSLRRRDPVFGSYETRTQLCNDNRAPPGDRASPDSLKPLAKVAPTLLSGNKNTVTTTTTTSATSTTTSVPNLRQSPPGKTASRPGRHYRGSAPSDLVRPSLEDSSYGESDHNALTPPKGSKKRLHPTARTEVSTISSSPSAITTSVAVASTTANTNLFQSNPPATLGIKALSNTHVWTSSTVNGTRSTNSHSSHTPTVHNIHNANPMSGTIVGTTATTTTTTNNTGPTPPFSCNSSSSSASSCYSSVSPAALSTTSGLGSSLSDPKSVDASPGEAAAATVLGNTYFCCASTGSNASATLGSTSTTQLDGNLLKSLEERIHRIYADRLIALTTERDQAREEVHRQAATIAQMRQDHEAELKQVKQRTWCQVCLNEAFYHCCLGTAYCSKTCQWQHWEAQHSQTCRRRAEAQLLQQQQQQQQQQPQSQSAQPLQKR